MTAKAALPTRKSAFAPACRADARLLILGSLPGEASLAARQYYAHPRNLFWVLVGHAIGAPDLPALAYAQRLERLAAARIGLWDTIASGERRGSLDAALREVEPAPLADLVATLPELRAVAFNGKTAARLGRRALSHTNLALIDLPSSSPAHAALSSGAKQAKWAVLRQWLG